jgi:SAM-dependent methyltransferase
MLIDRLQMPTDHRKGCVRRVIIDGMAATAESISRYQFKASRYSSHTLLLAEFPEHGEGRRVLDVGCAIGYLSEILAQRGFAVTSIDWPNSPHPPTVEFAGADLDDGLPPLRGQFDYVICADVLEHLRAPVELLKECHARLAPGGILVGSLPNSGHAYFRWNVLMGRFPQHQRGLFDSTHLHFYTWEGWTGLLGRAGFQVESVRCSGVPVSLAFPRWQGSLAVRVMEWLSFQAARTWKTMWAYQFIVRTRKVGTE